MIQLMICVRREAVSTPPSMMDRLLAESATTVGSARVGSKYSGAEHAHGHRRDYLFRSREKQTCVAAVARA